MIADRLTPEQVAAAIAGAAGSAWTRIRSGHGELVGVAADILVTLLPDGQTEMTTRRAIKGALTAAARQVEALVAELDGVRVYVMAPAPGQPARVVVTRRDLNL